MVFGRRIYCVLCFTVVISEAAFTENIFYIIYIVFFFLRHTAITLCASKMMNHLSSLFLALTQTYTHNFGSEGKEAIRQSEHDY